MGVGRVALALAVVAGCGGKRPPSASGHRDAGDAGATLDSAAADAGTADAAIARAGTAADYHVIDLADDATGTLAVTVLWPTASAAMRRSPGRTACGTARPPRARIGTLHGVAGAVVFVDVREGKPAPPAADVRVTLRDCALSPPVVVAPGLGGRVELQSQDEQPHRATAHALGLDGAGPGTAVASVALPAMGHVVSLPLPAADVVRLAADGADGDAAYVIAPPHPYVAITDDTGAVGFDRVPPGTHAVRAWLPPAADQPARAATGTATITAGGAATLTLTLAP